METDKIAVGKRIKNIRQENGYSMKEFGIEIGKLISTDRVKEGIISRWENGISLPNNERLKAIADIGETTVDMLLNPSFIGKVEFDYAKEVYEDFFAEKFNRYNFDEDDINGILERAILNAKETVKKTKSITPEGHQDSMYKAMIFSNIESGIQNILSEKVSDNFTLLNYLDIKIHKLASEAEIQKSKILRDGTDIVWTKHDGYSVEALEMIGKLFEDVSFRILDLIADFGNEHPKKHLKLTHFDMIPSQEIHYESLDDFINTLFNIIILDDKAPLEDLEDIDSNNIEITVNKSDIETVKEIIENSHDEIEKYYYKYLDKK